MTRTLTLGAVGALLGAIALLIAGLAGQAPGLMIVSILCVFPLFMLLLGATLGRASNEFQVVRKTTRQPVGSREINPRTQRLSQPDREALS
jgi:sorbitol-specific phosphotransferase system component IIBC